MIIAMSAEHHLDKRQLMRLAQAFDAEPAFITDLREPLPDLDPERLIKLAEDFYAEEEMKEKAYQSSIGADPVSGLV